MGTGALSSVEAQRTIEGRVVGDERAYLEINGFETSANSFAIETSDNQVRLDFDQDPDYTQFDGDDNTTDPDADDGENAELGNNEAEGLNPDAISTFDRVFRIQNDGTEALEVSIEEQIPEVEFYKGDTPNNAPVENVVLEPFDENADDDDDPPNSDPPASQIEVGVLFDLRGVSTTGDLFDSQDNFTIVAEETGP